MPTTQLYDLARMGAQSRLAALTRERDEILKMFPELRDGQPTARNNGSPKKRKDHVSPEARKRQAERMRAYWAERRARKAENDGAVKPASTKSSAKNSSGGARKGGGMSAEARKAQGERMKAYWAAKRAEKQAASGAKAVAAGATNAGSLSKKSGRKSGRESDRKQGRRS
jgi:hypothetical protein